MEAEPGSYIEISREWHDGDIISYQLPMSVHSEPATGSKTIQAFLFGPIVLAVDLGLGISNKSIPVLVSDKLNTSNLVTAVNKDSLQFNLEAVPENVRLVPYFLTGENTTCVYFSHLTQQQWKYQKKPYTLSLSASEIEKYSFDCLKPGYAQNQTYNQLSGNNLKLFTYEGKKCLVADRGWFSFRMKVSEEKPMELLYTYWGAPGEDHAFDIFIDKEFLTNLTIRREEKRFITRRTHIPLDYTLHKHEVTVVFKACADKSVAPVYECRLLNK